jgi:hypothetical protein
MLPEADSEIRNEYSIYLLNYITVFEEHYSDYIIYFITHQS